LNKPRQEFEQHFERHFEQHRSLLYGVAYRMLGSVADTEDILQETYLRWHQSKDIKNTKAFLITVVTRLCIDQLKSARHQREEYIGSWLPEPLVKKLGHQKGSDELLHLSETLSFAFMVLLEKLNPTERAVYILKQAFEFEYAEISEVVNKTESHCRQLDHRARKHIANNRVRYETDKQTHQRLYANFMKAIGSGETEELVKILASESILYSDGGGKVKAALRPIFGADKIARFFIGIGKKFSGRISAQPAILNGALGIITFDQGEIQGAISFAIKQGKVQNIFYISNPDKLKHIPSILDAAPKSASDSAT